MKTCKHIIFFISLVVLLFQQSAFCQAKVEEMKRKGFLLLQTDKINEAIEQFNLYIGAKPQSAEGYFLRGMCYEKKSLFQNAVSDFQTAVYMNPAEADYKKNLDRLTRIWHQQLYSNIEDNKKEVNRNPAQPAGYLEIARSYKYLGLNDYAEKWYDEYLKLDKDPSRDEIISYTEVLARTGSLLKGENILKTYTEKFPDDNRLWSRFGYFNLWLGKITPARDAFNKALSINPDFKEAADGIKLADNQEFALNKLSASPDSNSVISNYYASLKDKPNDDETRFQLVEQLIKLNRFTEAGQQLVYLQPNYEAGERYKAITASLEKGIEISAVNSIDDLKALLLSEPNNPVVVKKIADYYYSQSQLDESVEVYKNYLAANPYDNEMRYNYAGILAAGKRPVEAYSEIQSVLEKDKKQIKYRLLAGQIGVWLDRDTLETRNLLEGVLREDQENYSALLALATYNYQRMKLDSAKMFTERAKIIDSNDPNLVKLISSIETQKMRLEKEALWKKFETGQKLYKEEKFEEAKPYYEEIIKLGNPPSDLLSEFAVIQMNLKNYHEAITIYDSLMVKNPNMEFEKERGKAYLLSGDSLKSLSIFEVLAKENPDDVECQIYLGDSYAKLKKFDEARKIYKKAKIFALPKHEIDSRIGDLPPEPGTFRYFMRSFTSDVFSYLTLEPTGYYFNDNNDLDYLYGGIRGETNLNFAVAVGGEYIRGNVSNLIESIPFSAVKGSIYIKASERTSAGFSYGQMTFKGFKDIPVIDAFVKYDDKEYIKGELKYNMADGVTTLLSAGLVNNRIQTHSFKLGLAFNYEDKLKASADYRLLIIEKAEVTYENMSQYLKSNIGNYFSGRIGKGFYPGFFIGYEYFYADYKYTNLGAYYAPEEFNSHSLWASWQVASDYEWDINIEGKVGYVPQYDYILREGTVKLFYKLTGNFKIGLTGLIGDNVRFDSTYKSGSLYMNAIWAF